MGYWDGILVGWDTGGMGNCEMVNSNFPVGGEGGTAPLRLLLLLGLETFLVSSRAGPVVSWVALQATHRWLRVFEPSSCMINK